VLVDCAPGICVTTECWLRECEWHLIPVKPDVLAISGIQYLRDFKQRTPDNPFARHLGVVVNMKQTGSNADEKIHEILRSSREMACFPDAIPMIQHIQKSSICSSEPRSFQNKYPGDAGQALRLIAAELLGRISAGSNEGAIAVDRSSPSLEQDAPKQAARKTLLDKLMGREQL
jgi:cellulose biosynthesis protein BcsQ